MTACFVAYFTTGLDAVFTGVFLETTGDVFLETTVDFFLLPPLDFLATTGLAGAFAGAFFLA